jgi:hypothetical protein
MNQMKKFLNLTQCLAMIAVVALVSIDLSTAQAQVVAGDAYMPPVAAVPGAPVAPVYSPTPVQSYDPYQSNGANGYSNGFPIESYNPYRGYGPTQKYAVPGYGRRHFLPLNPQAGGYPIPNNRNTRYAQRRNYRPIFGSRRNNNNNNNSSSSCCSGY